MTDKSRAKLILERWTLGIKREDRKHENMPGIFDVLASQLFSAGVNFDTAHESMRTAAKLMYPVSETVKHVFARNPMKKFQNLQEFTKSWHESLDKSALTAFYSYYDIEGVDPTKIASKKNISVKPEPQGGMVTEDELNQEDFWKATRVVSRNKPWLFDDEDQTDG